MIMMCGSGVLLHPSRFRFIFFIVETAFPGALNTLGMEFSIGGVIYHDGGMISRKYLLV